MALLETAIAKMDTMSFIFTFILFCRAQLLLHTNTLIDRRVYRKCPIFHCAFTKYLFAHAKLNIDILFNMFISVCR